MRYKLLAILFLAVLLIGPVSALEFDNVKRDVTFDTESTITIGDKNISYREIWERYGPIRIDNIFGLGETLWEGAIDEHTEESCVDCYSTMDINIANDDSLVDDVKFYTIEDDGSRTQEDIMDYQFYIKTGQVNNVIQDYEWQCVDTGKLLVNGSNEQSCSDVNTGSHIEVESIWQEYEMGTVKRAGTYTVKLEGKKEMSKTVDWVIKVNGKTLDEWASWPGSTKIEFFEVKDNAQSTAASTTWLQQSFTIGTLTANETYDLRGVCLMISNTPSGDDFITVRIYNATNGEANNSLTLLSANTSVSLPAISFPTSECFNITMPSANLHSNEQYGIVMFRNSGSDAVFWEHERGSPTYPGGNWGKSTDSGSSWTDTTWDGWFQVWADIFVLGGNISASQVLPANNTNIINISNQMVDLSCDFVSTGILNISNVSVSVYNSSDDLAFSNIDTTPNNSTQSFSRTWTTGALEHDTYNWECFGTSGNNTIVNTGNISFNIVEAPSVWDDSIFIGDEYQLIAIVENIDESGIEINDVEVHQISNILYKINTTNTDDEVSRALIMKTLFFGTSGTDPRATSEFINATWIFSSDTRDNGKRGIYASIDTSGDPDLDFSYIGVFENNLTNNDVSSWSNVQITGSINNGTFLVNETVLNSVLGSSNSNEIGTDTSADDSDNPIDTRLSSHHFVSGLTNLKAIILTNGTISFSGASGANPTNTDFFINESFPEMYFPNNTVILNSPVDNFFSPSPIQFTCSAEILGGAELVNISLFTNATGTFELSNTTSVTGLSNQSVMSLDFADGNYIWGCQACGTDDNCGFSNSNRSIVVDTISPIINLTAPSGAIASIVIGNNLSANWTVSDANLDSCWFEYNNINTTVVCTDNNRSFITIQDEQSLTFYANDTSGNLGNDTTSWTYDFVENNLTFNAEVFETSNQDFILNLSTDETILSISGVLNYDSVDYLSIISCELQTCILSNNIDIPLIESGLNVTNNFFWNFTIFNGTSSNNIQTSTRQQIVNRTFLELCNATITIETLNFTAVDEINLSRIDNFQFDSTFDFWIGNGDVKRNNSYSTNGTEVNLCMLDDLTYSVDAQIDYDEFGNTTTYISRFYYFDNHSINSTRQDISLFLLQSSFSTSFILKVQDQNLLPVENALITIQRCYADEPECRTVQIARTDENGKSIGFFQTETVDYKFIITKNGEILLETGEQKVVPETSPFTLTFNVGQDLGEPWAGQNEIINLNSSLIFNKTSGIVTYVYIDSSNNFTSATLNVTRNSLNNASASVIVCNEISTLASSTIFCDVGNTTGFYTASAFITRSGTGLDKQISFQIEDISSIVGELGLFFGFFLILVAMFMFKFNEIAGIWITVVTIALINITGLIKFGGVFVTATIVLAIIITWLLER